MMLLYSLAFLLGDVYFQQSHSQPSIMMLSIMLIMAISLSLLIKPMMRVYLAPIIFMLGFTWAACSASHIEGWQLPDDWEGRPVVVQGTIQSLVTRHDLNFQFTFMAASINNQPLSHKMKINVSWPAPPRHLMPGDEWQLLVKLKRLHGLQNPGQVDLGERSSMFHHIRASGYVLNGQENTFIQHHSLLDWPDQWRQRLARRLEMIIPDSPSLPWLKGLMMGDRSQAAVEDWDVLRKTGTNHLMAIAGLHIGLAAGVARWLALFCWRKKPSLNVTVNDIGACAALITAWFYGLMAGFSIPTQRACLMLSILIIALLLRIRLTSWYVWGLAMWCVVLFEPLSVLSDSFWLSFATIAVIIYGMQGRIGMKSIWWQWGRIQTVITMGLIPLSLYCYHDCSLIAILANCISVPLLAFIILPLCLLSDLSLLLLPSLSAGFVKLAAYCMMLLWDVLHWFASLPLSSIHLTISSVAILFIVMIGVAILIMPNGQPGRLFAIAWLMPLFFRSPIHPAEGNAWVTVLDVGQGLSVVVQTSHHVLVYDAGPKFGKGFDAGKRVVVPYLEYNGIKQVDALIISHGDNDHIGGAASILAMQRVSHIYTSVPDRIPSPVTETCRAGQQWEWDKVHFSMIYPEVNQLGRVNDSSCVLRMDIGEHAVLLPGDIEHFAERQLLAERPEQLRADVLVAPHHGSKTSGEAAFISAVYPRYVIYSTGYHNRYHFPHPSVVKAYRKINAIQLNTANTGAISMQFVPGQPDIGLQLASKKEG